MGERMKRFSYILGLVAVLGILAIPSLGSAAIYTGSGTISSTGNDVSAQADISISGSNLIIQLQNTTDGGTLKRSDLLTGLAFDVAGTSLTSLHLSSIALTPGSALIPGKDPVTGELSGSWTDVLGSAPISEFGVASTGFSNAFSAAHITRGSGGEDYSLAAVGTFPAPPGTGDDATFNKSAFPLIQDSLTFTFNIGGSLALSQLENVRFLFGTSGTDVVQAVPEPATVAMWSAFGCIGALIAWRKRRRAA